MTVASKGSKLWLQIAVNRHPRVIDAAIRATGVASDEQIEWCSPLGLEDFDEYGDDKFLSKLDVSLGKRTLNCFWPRQGPQWDGLARSGSQLLLVEAKANIPELKSACKAKSPCSIQKIERSFCETRAFLGADVAKNWLCPYYQYANRLAHLYLLRELNDLDAYLLFVYFVGDQTTTPTSRDEWREKIQEVKDTLGLPLKSAWLESHVKEVFLDTADLLDVKWPFT